MAKNTIKEALVKEYIRCSQDPVYFMRKYCFIQHPQKGKIKFDLFPFQEDSLVDLKDNRFKLTEVNGRKVYIPPEAVETQNIEDDIKDFFKNDQDDESKNNNKNKEISFNPVKNDRRFELDKKSKDVFIPFNEVYTNNNIAFNRKEDSLQLNSDNDNGYNSLDNQFIQALT